MKTQIKRTGAVGVLATAILFTILQGCQTSVNKPVKAVMKNNTDSASYALGAQLGSSLKKDGLDTILNIQLLMQGIQNGVLDTAGMTSEQIANIVQTFFQKEMEKKNAVLSEASNAFMAQNGKKPGITTTASGLQYEVIQEGSGAKPTAESVVSVNYKGSLINGNVFDQSPEGQPAEIPLNRVIPGWSEGIALMTVGSKYKFYIPGNLGYGPNGNPQGGIGPNEVLIFDVELLGIK
jgi:FKBP-type peptidyl-prolyl cis-trans isomerase FklB